MHKRIGQQHFSLKALGQILRKVSELGPATRHVYLADGPGLSGLGQIVIERTPDLGDELVDFSFQSVPGHLHRLIIGNTVRSLHIGKSRL